MPKKDTKVLKIQRVMSGRRITLPEGFVTVGEYVSVNQSDSRLLIIQRVKIEMETK